MNSTLHTGDTRGNESAFTLLELVIVLFVIAMLAALLLPALAATRLASEAAQCLENQRRFVLAWRLYSDDYNGALVRNGGVGNTALSTNEGTAKNGNWVHGVIGTLYGTPRSSTNTALIKAGALFPYANNVAIYKCPADKKNLNVNGTPLPTSRSISMNGWLNPITPFYFGYRNFRKQSDITNPAPADLWVALDESPGSINDPVFACDPGTSVWVDIPASYHGGGSGISFADGHAMIRKWTDPVVLRGDLPPTAAPEQSPPSDLQWLQARATSHL